MLVKKYSLKTVSTNYIVWKSVLIPNFGLVDTVVSHSIFSNKITKLPFTPCFLHQFTKMPFAFKSTILLVKGSLWSSFSLSKTLKLLLDLSDKAQNIASLSFLLQLMKIFFAFTSATLLVVSASPIFLFFVGKLES